MPTCLRLADERVCSCKKAHDDVGYHVLNCSRNNKKNWPDYIYNGLATALAPPEPQLGTFSPPLPPNKDGRVYVSVAL